MKANEKRAWGYLDKSEQTALSLQYAFSKSSWEAGQMMARSHYKYLEIKYRAEKFFKMYTEHIDVFQEVVPDYLFCQKDVLQYFKYCLEDRLKPAIAINKIEQAQDKRIIKSELNKKIEETMNRWQNSEQAIEATMVNFIKDFDRWNNFRILPRSCQEPSAFKRRIKNTYKRHIRMLNSIPNISIEKIRELFETKKTPCVFLPLIIEKTPWVIKIQNKPKTVEALSEISFYIYEDDRTAREYIEAIADYCFKNEKDCKDGLEFWPVYRDIIKKAINYQKVQQITPSRKYLDLALQKLSYL